MKRHPRLQQLSREHHDALKLAQQAQRAADQNAVQRVGAACVLAFEQELEPHFRVEETDLLPLLLAQGETRLAQRLQSEHAELQTLAAKLRQPCAEDLLAFGVLLTAHVRFEERELFIAIEHAL